MKLDSHVCSAPALRTTPDQAKTSASPAPERFAKLEPQDRKPSIDISPRGPSNQNSAEDKQDPGTEITRVDGKTENSNAEEWSGGDWAIVNEEHPPNLECTFDPLLCVPSRLMILKIVQDVPSALTHERAVAAEAGGSLAAQEATSYTMLLASAAPATAYPWTQAASARVEVLQSEVGALRYKLAEKEEELTSQNEVHCCLHASCLDVSYGTPLCRFIMPSLVTGRPS